MVKYLRKMKAAFAVGNTYPKGKPTFKPGMRFDHFKIWNDGVSVAPSNTGALSSPVFLANGSLGEMVPPNYSISTIKNVRAQVWLRVSCSSWNSSSSIPSAWIWACTSIRSAIKAPATSSQPSRPRPISSLTRTPSPSPISSRPTRRLRPLLKAEGPAHHLLPMGSSAAFRGHITNNGRQAQNAPQWNSLNGNYDTSAALGRKRMEWAGALCSRSGSRLMPCRTLWRVRQARGGGCLRQRRSD
jgi:hypothetical protein